MAVETPVTPSPIAYCPARPFFAELVKKLAASLASAPQHTGSQRNAVGAFGGPSAAGDSPESREARAALLETLYNNMPCVEVSRSGHILSASVRVVPLVGMKVEDLVGVEVWSFFDEVRAGDTELMTCLASSHVY